MPWCKKSKMYLVQKFEKAQQVSLSNGRRFETRYTKKAEGVDCLPSYVYQENKGNRKSVTHSSCWSSANLIVSLLRTNTNA